MTSYQYSHDDYINSLHELNRIAVQPTAADAGTIHCVRSAATELTELAASHLQGQHISRGTCVRHDRSRSHCCKMTSMSQPMPVNIHDLKEERVCQFSNMLRAHNCPKPRTVLYCCTSAQTREHRTSTAAAHTATLPCWHSHRCHVVTAGAHLDCHPEEALQVAGEPLEITPPRAMQDLDPAVYTRSGVHHLDGVFESLAREWSGHIPQVHTHHPSEHPSTPTRHTLLRLQ
jgi:hypothetical protein